MLSATGGTSARFPVGKMAIHPFIWMDGSVITVSELLILSYLVPKYLDAY